MRILIFFMMAVGAVSVCAEGWIINPGRGGRCKSKRQLYACNTKKLLLLELYGSFLFRFHNAVDLISKKFKYNTFFLNDQENAFSEIVEINLVLK